MQRVMPSGFFVLLRHFLRIDDVLIRMHDTRFHYEIENDYILKEYIHREAPCTQLQVKNSFIFPSKTTYDIFFCRNRVQRASGRARMRCKTICP